MNLGVTKWVNLTILAYSVFDRSDWFVIENDGSSLTPILPFDTHIN